MGGRALAPDTLEEHAMNPRQCTIVYIVHFRERLVKPSRIFVGFLSDFGSWGKQRFISRHPAIYLAGLLVFLFHSRDPSLRKPYDLGSMYGPLRSVLCATLLPQRSHYL